MIKRVPIPCTPLEWMPKDIQSIVIDCYPNLSEECFMIHEIFADFTNDWLCDKLDEYLRDMLSLKEGDSVIISKDVNIPSKKYPYVLVEDMPKEIRSIVIYEFTVGGDCVVRYEVSNDNSILDNWIIENFNLGKGSVIFIEHYW